jgi:hypothetical protein
VPAPRREVSRKRRALEWTGGALAVAGRAFVGLRFRDYWRQIDLRVLGAPGWLGRAGLALTYGAANMLLARAWWHMLTFLEADPDGRVEVAWAIRTDGASQQAKYMPGNVTQFAGRHVLATALGLRGTAVAKSSVSELGMLCTLAVVFGALAAPLLVPAVTAPVAVVTFASVLGAAGIATSRWLGGPIGARTGEPGGLPDHLGVGLHGGLGPFCAVLGGRLGTPVLCGAYVIAWLAGLVTSGAPAGAGVREAALLLLLDGCVGPVKLLLAVLFGRIAMVAGDVALLAATSLPLLRSRSRAS